jgi:hypothetical protein
MVGLRRINSNLEDRSSRAVHSACRREIVCITHGSRQIRTSGDAAAQGRHEDRGVRHVRLDQKIGSKGNAVLFEQESRNGTDPDLKEFPRQALPKIVDHLRRAERPAAAAGGRLASK